jgi:hypothetical protein
MHNEELHGLYSLPRIIRIIKKDETGETCNAHVR